jgi:two-component system cell cycle response regulator DivK
MSSKLSVLVVDDSSDGRDMLVVYLAFRGFQVAEARNGAEALDVARRVQPDIILMDLSMPEVDGWEATRRLKADPVTQRAVIVAVTAHVFPREQNAARAAGCDVVIAKPFDLTVLADALEGVALHGLGAFGAKADAVGRSRHTKTSEDSSG